MCVKTRVFWHKFNWWNKKREINKKCQVWTRFGVTKCVWRKPYGDTVLDECQPDWRKASKSGASSLPRVEIGSEPGREGSKTLFQRCSKWNEVCQTFFPGRNLDRQGSDSFFRLWLSPLSLSGLSLDLQPGGEKGLWPNPLSLSHWKLVMNVRLSPKGLKTMPDSASLQHFTTV